MVHSPITANSDALIAKCATPPIYTSLKPEKGILLKDVKTSNPPVDRQTYGYLPTTLVLSEVNDTYTSLSESHKPGRQVTISPLQFNEV